MVLAACCDGRAAVVDGIVAIARSSRTRGDDAQVAAADEIWALHDQRSFLDRAAARWFACRDQGPLNDPRFSAIPNGGISKQRCQLRNQRRDDPVGGWRCETVASTHMREIVISTSSRPLSAGWRRIDRSTTPLRARRSQRPARAPRFDATTGWQDTRSESTDLSGRDGSFVTWATSTSSFGWMARRIVGTAACPILNEPGVRQTTSERARWRTNLSRRTTETPYLRDSS